ncbi:MAG: hypothetical protein WBL19_01605 [Minisyncoccia bacterium]
MNIILNLEIVNMSFLKRYFSWRKEPRVNIQYGRLIDPVFIFYCQNNPELKKKGWSEWKPPEKEELEKRINAYKNEWKKYTITKDISNCLNLSFNRDVIDVYIVSGISRASSNPIIIKSGFTPKEFVATLAHELIHVILTNNRIKRIKFDEKESDTTNNHVIVFSVLKKILDTDLWDITTRRTSDHSTNEYSEALTLMEKIGPDNVIKKMTGQSD